MLNSKKMQMEELKRIAAERRHDANAAFKDLMKAESEFAAEHFNCNVGDVIVGRRADGIPDLLYLVKGFAMNNEGEPVIQAALLEEVCLALDSQYKYEHLYATAVDQETAPRVFRGCISGGEECAF